MMLEWVLSSCVLILVVLALRAALGKKITAKLRYALWAVVLLRLLIPVQLFTSPVAGFRLQTSKAMEERSIYVVPTNSAPVEDAASIGAYVTENGQVGVTSSMGYARLEDGGKTVVRYADKISPMELVKWLWGIGAAMLALILLISNLRFASKLRRARKPLEGAGGCLPVYTAEGLPSPCLFGLLRPAIYVTPNAVEDEAMLRHVLVHEETHYRHWDHVWSLLRIAALVLHWWNPLVWLAVILSRRDGELACDEGALKRLGDGERRAYGETLMALVTAKPQPCDLLTCATTMSGDKKRLKERICRIAWQSKPVAGAVIAVVAVTVLAVLCAFSRMAAPAEPEEGEGPSQEGYFLQEELSYKPDLNRDGEPEHLLVMATEDQMEYSLWVLQGTDSLWQGSAAQAHAGWNAYFLTELDGEDYLLWYQPYMGQGSCNYRYRLFYLENGQEVTVQEGSVQFDINFSSDTHGAFDPKAIAAFVDEINTLLKNSVQLLNTDENLLATFEQEGELIDSLWWLGEEGEDFTWDSQESLEDVLRQFEAYARDHPDDTDNSLKEYLEVLTAADITDDGQIDQADREQLGRLLRAASGQRVSRVYAYDSFAEQDISGFARAEMSLSMADGSVLFLAATDSGNVYICHETGEGAPSAFFEAGEDLYDFIILHAGAEAGTSNAPTVDEIFSSIQAENISHLGNFTTTIVAADALADALNGAAGKWQPYEGDTVEGFIYDISPYWSIYAEYMVPAWSASEQTITLDAGLKENLVLVTCSGYYASIQYSENPSVGGTYLHDNAYRYTVMVEDETLYWLVRRAYDYPEKIARELVSPMYEAIMAKMEGALQLAQSEQPETGYTGYELTAFYPLVTFDDIVPGAEVTLYANSFALLLEHPEKMVWAGGVYLDSQLRERGFYTEAGGLLAVVWKDGEAQQYRFLANDFYPALENAEWMEEYGRPYIEQALADPNFW